MKRWLGLAIVAASCASTAGLEDRQDVVDVGTMVAMDTADATGLEAGPDSIDVVDAAMDSRTDLGVDISFTQPDHVLPPGAECRDIEPLDCRRRYPTPDDPGAVWACCNGRCFAGSACVRPAPDADRVAYCNGEPACDRHAGRLCCFGGVPRAPRCVSALSGFCVSGP